MSMGVLPPHLVITRCSRRDPSREAAGTPKFLGTPRVLLPRSPTPADSGGHANSTPRHGPAMHAAKATHDSLSGLNHEEAAAPGSAAGTLAPGADLPRDRHP